MSRFSEGDCDSNYGYLWESRVERVINGKRGQRMLRELVDALLALPERRLIAGAIAKPSGEVCAVGALAKYRGVDVAHYGEPGKANDDDTARLGEMLGLTYTLAWEIGFKNDVEYGGPYVRRHYVQLDVPIIEEPDPRDRYDEASRQMPRPRFVTSALIPDYHARHIEGVSPEERWNAIYRWACSNVRWNLPVPRPSVDRNAP